MTTIERLEQADADTEFVKLRASDNRAAILALNECYRVLMESGQLEVRPPKALLRVFGDLPADESPN